MSGLPKLKYEYSAITNSGLFGGFLNSNELFSININIGINVQEQSRKLKSTATGTFLNRV